MLVKVYAGLCCLLIVAGLLALFGAWSMGADAAGDMAALDSARLWLTGTAAALLPAGWIGLGVIVARRP